MTAWAQRRAAQLPHGVKWIVVDGADVAGREIRGSCGRLARDWRRPVIKSLSYCLTKV